MEDLSIQFSDQPATDPGMEISFIDQPAEPHWINRAGDLLAKWGWVGGPATLGVWSAAKAMTRDVEQPTEQKTAKGVIQAGMAGYESSVSSLVQTGRLPDLVLDPEHATWYEKLAAGVGQMAGDFPAMVLGDIAGTAAATETGPAAPLVGSAAAFAVPTAIRESLMQSYAGGQVNSTAEFLHRTSIVLKATGRDAIVGGLTAGVGKLATKTLSPIATGTAGKIVAGTMSTGAEVGTMTLAPALLEGKLPEPEDFVNGAILVGGLKSAHLVSGKMLTLYARTGARPGEVVAHAATSPEFKAELLDPDAPMPKAYQEAATRQAAVDAVPGLAKEVAKEFYGPSLLPGEPAPTKINYRYLNAPEHVTAALDRLSALNEAEIQTQRRGAVPWDQTQHEAGLWLRDHLGPETQIEPRSPGTAAGAAELLARKQLLQGAAEDMAGKAREFLDLGTNATPEHQAVFLASIDRAAMIQAEFLGARAEAGRALNILRETKVAAQRARQIQEVLNQFGKSPEELAHMLATIDNPASALKFAKEATKATRWEQFVEFYKASLVSGPVTQLANILGNSTMVAVRPAVDLVAATFGRVTGAQDRVRFAEPMARLAANLQGVADGLKVARAVFGEEAIGGKVEQHRQAIPGTAGKVIRTPFRALGAADALFRTMIERGEAYALATREAIKEGHHPQTREFRERVVELATNPTEAMTEQIRIAGERGTFSAPLGETGRAVTKLVKAAHLEPVVPFIATPANVFKEMARLSPAAPLLKEWRADVATGGPAAAKAMAEMSLGYAVSAFTMGLAKSGMISGAGDPDPAKRRTAQAAGWQPYSLKVGDTWYSFQRIQPIGTLMGMAADVAESWDYLAEGDGDKALNVLGIAFANSVTNQTFLQGLANLTGAMTEPTRRLPRLLQNTATALIPSALSQTAQIIDPYQREVYSILDAAKNRVPGLRQTLQVQRDLFGEPVPSTERIGGVLPLATRDASTDKVRLEAARLGIGDNGAPKSIQLPAAGQTDIGRVDLTPEQRDVFGDVAGHLAHQTLVEIVNAPDWDTLPDMLKAKVYRDVLQRTREAGKDAALSDAQRQAEIQRIMAEVSKRLGE